MVTTKLRKCPKCGTILCSLCGKPTRSKYGICRTGKCAKTNTTVRTRAWYKKNAERAKVLCARYYARHREEILLNGKAQRLLAKQEKKELERIKKKLEKAEWGSTGERER
jgi:hypothetical protein